MPPQPQRALKYFYLRFIRLKGDPSTLAKGVAIGVFVSARRRRSLSRRHSPWLWPWFSERQRSLLCLPACWPPLSLT